ncbi:MAG: LysM peptidoglycan-binding domain-containing protein [Neisseriaceae bacterium]|nr:LysM peptidoglycan-binding domain-containing protein [Neisseriaceae bacterium]
MIMKSMKKILAIAISSLFALPTLANNKTNTLPNTTGIGMMRLQTSIFTPTAGLHGKDIWSNLRNDFRLDEVNTNLVRSHEYKFSTNQAYFNRTINRSIPYMYHIVNEVQKRGMPAEIALLPFIESAFVTKARSHVGASGLWQFMPATGRHYGLEQTALYDGRHDIYAATNAALNYLEYLYGLFGDWSLALAAYNWGEGNVSRAIRKAQEKGLPPTYENLNMPAETRNYVPKLLAVRNLVNNPKAFGLKLPDVANKPYFREVQVKEPIDIMAAAFLAGIPESEFLALNPAFKTPVFIPKSNKRRMLLPIQAANQFEQNYRNADLKTLLSWDVFTPSTTMDLNTLAAQTGSTVSELKRLNGITGNTVAAGRTILLNKNSTVSLNLPSSTQVDTDYTPDTYVEQAPVLLRKPIETPKSSSLAAHIEPTQKTAPINTKLPEKNAQQMALKPAETLNVAQQDNVQNNQALANLNNTSPVQKTVAQVENKLPETTTLASATPNASVNNVENDTITPKSLASNTETNNIPENIQAAQNTDPIDEEEDVLLALIERQQRKAEAFNLAHATLETQITTPNLVQNTAPHSTKAIKEKTIKETVEQKNSNTNLSKNNVKTINYKVSAGENLSTIAQKNGTTVTELKALNQLKNEQIQQGQVLKIAQNKNNNKPTHHKVASGETLFSIAKQYNLNINELAAANDIKKDGNLKAGQTLKIAFSKADIKTDKTDKDKKEKATSVYQVKKGDTLDSIAKRHNMTQNELATLNNIKGSNIQAGQELKIVSSKAEKNKTAASKKEKVPATYEVKKGDTLDSIAKRYQLDVNDLKRLNKGSGIKAGQKIKLS